MHWPASLSTPLTTMSAPVTVAMVDDQPVYRLGLSRLLQRSDQFSILWSAGSVAQALRDLERKPVDLVLMDLQFADGGDGIHVLQTVRRRWPQTKVLVVSALADRQMAAAVKAAGAVGIVGKEASLADLLAAIRNAVTRGAVKSSTVGSNRYARRAASAGAVSSSEALGRLTGREREVLDEIRRGMTNREIALRLGVSPSTVNKHVHRVLTKLGARNRAQAAIVR
jgi:DNA-binding NarL/FixJ family response regulator